MLLKLKSTPEVPIEAPTICTDRFKKRKKDEIKKLPIHHGNREVSIGDFFEVTGEYEEEIKIEGDLSKVKLIGAGMKEGKIIIEGNAGMHVGVDMKGGEIVVEGNAADWVAPRMSGGLLTVKGNAGHMVGSAFRGEKTGMTGGEIIVHGNAGNETGGRMRGGMIAIGGDVGDFSGVDMHLGTIIILGKTGIRQGAGMERGTIICMNQVEPLPTFTFACSYQPLFMRNYLLRLKELGMKIDEKKINEVYERWSGDSIKLNRGELLFINNQSLEKE